MSRDFSLAVIIACIWAFGCSDENNIGDETNDDIWVNDNDDFTDDNDDKMDDEEDDSDDSDGEENDDDDDKGSDDESAEEAEEDDKDGDEDDDEESDDAESDDEESDDEEDVDSSDDDEESSDEEDVDSNDDDEESSDENEDEDDESESEEADNDTDDDTDEEDTDGEDTDDDDTDGEDTDDDDTDGEDTDAEDTEDTDNEDTGEDDTEDEDTGTGGSSTSTTGLVGIETPGDDCAHPDAEWGDWDGLPEIAKLPDPFTMIDGTAVTTKEQWTCRHREISALLQKWELGRKPPKPDSVTGSYSNGNLTINVTDGGSDLSFSVSIQHPGGGSGPYPALIGLAGGNLPTSSFTNNGVAIIDYNHDQMGNQTGQRGGGQYFQLYNEDAGALLAWAWGASRIIDALEVTPEANIDPTRLAVNGCSRNGKGALMIGALDSRIALTIPQEGGSGGPASWRVSQTDKDNGVAGGDIQTLESAHGEQPWFRENFGWFGAYVDKVPIDHHQVMGLVAPRGLFVIQNPQYNWLGHNSGNQASGAARDIYEALGAKENFGHVESSHAHCSFPSSEVPDLENFIKKFLLDQEVDTNVWVVANDFNRSQWASWDSVPNLQ